MRAPTSRSPWRPVRCPLLGCLLLAAVASGCLDDDVEEFDVPGPPEFPELTAYPMDMPYQLPQTPFYYYKSSAGQVASTSGLDASSGGPVALAYDAETDTLSIEPWVTTNVTYADGEAATEDSVLGSVTREARVAGFATGSRRRSESSVTFEAAVAPEDATGGQDPDVQLRLELGPWTVDESQGAIRSAIHRAWIREGPGARFLDELADAVSASPSACELSIETDLAAVTDGFRRSGAAIGWPRVGTADAR